MFSSIPASEPITFSKLHYSVQTNNVAHLARNSAFFTEYMKKMSSIKEEFISVSDYILFHVFNFNTSIEEITGKRIAIKPSSLHNVAEDSRYELLSNCICRLVPNDFPYWFEEGLTHSILWIFSLDQKSEPSLEQVHKFIQQKYSKEAYDYVTWKNPTNLKSIKDIEHYHVVWRKKVQQS